MINYYAQDFAIVKDNLIKYLKDNYGYDDSLATDISGIFIDLTAYITTQLNWLLNNRTAEVYLSEATLPENVYNISRQLGYKPAGAVPASITLKLTVDERVKETIQILARSTIISKSGQKYSILQDLEINEGFNIDDEFLFSALEGYYITQEYFAKGNKNETVVLDIPDNYYLAQGKIEVFVNGEQWSEVDYFNYKREKVFEVDYLNNRIIFGDGLSGLQLSENDYVVINFFATKGSAGVVSASEEWQFESVIKYSDGKEFKPKIINEEKSSSAKDKDTIDYIKAIAPRYFAMNERYVSVEDIKTAVLKYLGRGKVMVLRATHISTTLEQELDNLKQADKANSLKNYIDAYLDGLNSDAQWQSYLSSIDNTALRDNINNRLNTLINNLKTDAEIDDLLNKMDKTDLQNELTDYLYNLLEGIINKETIYDLFEYINTINIENALIAYADGSNLTYTGNFNVINISPSTLTISYYIGGSNYTATDDGAGNITGTNLNGTIDYAAGTYTLNFTTAPDNNTNITASYNVAKDDFVSQLKDRISETVNDIINDTVLNQYLAQISNAVLISALRNKLNDKLDNILNDSELSGYISQVANDTLANDISNYLTNYLDNLWTDNNVSNEVNSIDKTSEVENIKTELNNIISDTSKANWITIYYVDEDSDGFYVAPAQAVIDDLANYLNDQSRKILSVYYEVLSAASKIRYVDVLVKVNIKETYKADIVLQNLSSAIDELLKGRNFGEELYLSEVYDKLADIEGVRYLIAEISDNNDTEGIRNIYDDDGYVYMVKPKMDEIITKGTVNLQVISNG